jgi:hypothetical protein
MSRLRALSAEVLSRTASRGTSIPCSARRWLTSSANWPPCTQAVSVLTMYSEACQLASRSSSDPWAASDGGCPAMKRTPTL